MALSCLQRRERSNLQRRESRDTVLHARVTANEGSVHVTVESLPSVV